MNWEGLLPLNKPAGKTSHAVVEELRSTLRYRKIGHTGTLDPFATGLLLTCLGKAVKIAGFLQGLDKEYRAKIKLGTVTDTYDIDGRILRVEEKLSLQPNRIRNTIEGFQGEINQVPPIYSALRYKGKRLYDYAREGKKVERTARRVNIRRIDQMNVHLPYVEFRVLCSKGTYIRSLAFDIGEELGCGAYLHSLCRTKIGPFGLEDSLTISEVKDLFDKNMLSEGFYSIAHALSHLPSVSVNDNSIQKLRSGAEIKLADLELPWSPFQEGDLVVIKQGPSKVLAITRALFSSKELKNSKTQSKIFEYERVLT